MAEAVRTIVCVGATHHTATLAVRERFALVGERGRDVIAALEAHPAVEELVTLATCNRSELYLVGDRDSVTRAAVEALAQLGGVDADDELTTLLEVRVDMDAVEHLLRTAGGIESVVTGEAQIQGQLRLAHEAARDAGSCGPVLDRLFRQAVETGKRARSETRIGSGRASVGSVAAELVAGRIGELEDARVAVIGAGKMGGLAARSLADRGARRIDVVNRTGERAARVAAECGGTGVGIPFDQLDDELAQCDAVVSSTNAPHMVITRERIADVMRRRGGRPIVLVDLAVPRDIDAACAEVEGVHVFDLDDLERVVADTLDVRGDAVDHVARIAAEGVDAFGRWLRALDATPAIRELRERAERERRAELDRFIARHAHLAEADIERIDRLTRSIVNRVLHAPTVRLRQAAERA